MMISRPDSITSTTPEEILSPHTLKHLQLHTYRRLQERGIELTINTHKLILCGSPLEEDPSSTNLYIPVLMCISGWVIAYSFCVWFNKWTSHCLNDNQPELRSIPIPNTLLDGVTSVPTVPTTLLCLPTTISCSTHHTSLSVHISSVPPTTYP